MPYPLKSARRLVAIIALVLWALSLVLPAASFARSGYEYAPGVLIAMVGIVFGWAIFQFGAFANPILLLICARLFFGAKAWVWLAMIAEILALWSFTWSDFPDDAGDNLIQHFSSGFYAWQLAIVLVAAYALFEKRLIMAGYIAAPVVIIPQS